MGDLSKRICGQHNGGAAWRAADGANRAKAAAHRGADAEPTSPGAASMSATQLMPASGPPASARRFPARIRPSPAWATQEQTCDREKRGSGAALQRQWPKGSRSKCRRRLGLGRTRTVSPCFRRDNTHGEFPSLTTFRARFLYYYFRWVKSSRGAEYDRGRVRRGAS